jgi:hypothetical protein
MPVLWQVELLEGSALKALPLLCCCLEFLSWKYTSANAALQTVQSDWPIETITLF